MNNQQKDRKMPSQYGLTDLPQSIVLRTEENANDESIVKWSGSYPIPQIGKLVSVNFNQLGTGIIESYFVEHGYCGLTVRLDKEPEWKIRQHKGTQHEGVAMVFGLEITVLN